MNEDEQRAMAANCDPARRARRRAEEETRTTVRLRMVAGLTSIESVSLFRSSTRSKVVVDLERDDQLEREIAAYAAESERRARERDETGGVALDPIIQRVGDWRVSVTSGGSEIARVRHRGLRVGGSQNPNRAIWFFQHIPAGIGCDVSLADDDGQFFAGRFWS